MAFEITGGNNLTPTTLNQKSCDHCGMDIAMRNPSGFCDHLYYPENCGVCHKKHGKPTYYSLEQALEAERKMAEELRKELERVNGLPPIIAAMEIINRDIQDKKGLNKCANS